MKILPGSAMLSSQCVSNLTWKNYFWWEQHFSLDAWPFLPTSDTVASKCMDYIGDFILQTEAGQDIFNRIISYLKKTVAFESGCSGKVLKLQHSQKAGAEIKCFFIYFINSLELHNALIVL